MTYSRKRIYLLGIATLLLSFPPESLAQGTTRFVSVAVPSTGPFVYFGPGGNRRVGETFDVTSDATILTSFSFYLTPSPSLFQTGERAGVLLTPSISEWDGSRPAIPLWTGPSLLTGEVGSIRRQIFFTGGISLDPTLLYVAVLSAVDDGIHTETIGLGCTCIESTSAEYHAVASPDYYGGPGLVNDAWNEESYSASFQAEFTTAPEPASLTLLATGLLAVGVVRRTRKMNSDVG